MYCTHTIHKNLNPLYPDPGYTTIGDPYKGEFCCVIAMEPSSGFLTLP